MEKGVGVWLRDAETDEWHRALVVKIKDGGDAAKECVVTLRLTEGPKARTETSMTIDVLALEEEKIDNLLLANSADMDVVEDLIQLPHLHEPGIGHTLNERFKINEIYTLTGEILLALNPFKNIGIYSDKVIRKYIRHGDKRSLGQELPDMPPHVFAVADKAYRSLASPLAKGNHAGQNNQSILVSGESGAGKTESTKFIMQYLANISQQVVLSNSQVGARRKSSTPSMQGSDTSVMDQVLSSNPILESFGNARTIRNDNSSRFGKFIKMEFSSKQNANGKIQLVGASIQTYLLEKVRLAYQAEAERNYHVFYEMLAGASSVEKERWQLMAPTSFHYLNQSTCVTRRDGVDDAVQFRVLKSAMRTMGFDDERMESIFATVAALLHLGNLEFDDVDHTSGADGSKLSDSKQSTKSMGVVLSYFGCDRETLEKALCHRQITAARDETYSISLPANEAENTRDAFARFMYGKLFDWLVARINDTVSCENEYSAKTTSFIGLLDIFGFEDLAHNSFEQLCINYANETLQQHFNLTVLRLEQETYEREQISWSFINFPDNAPCIALIEARPFGILPALDEECVVPQGNDQNFSRKLYRQHEKNEHFSASKTEKANHLFVVHHYAGRVTYDSFGFCEKNKDVLYAEITNLMQSPSSPEFVRELVKVGNVAQTANPRRKSSAVVAVKGRAGSSAANSKQSLGAQFRTQLRHLIDTINVTSCHYVRCIKPNDRAQSDEFDFKRVCDQLKAGGVLEAVRVNRAGYPVRIYHQQFLKRYRPLANGSYLRRLPEEAGKDDAYDADERKEAASLLADFLRRAYVARHPDLVEKSESKNLDEVLATGVGIQVGLTRVFFRRSTIQFVEAQLAKRYGELVVLIQAAARGLIARRQYERAKTSLVVIQKVVRGFITRCRYYVLREKKRRQEAEKRRLEEEKRRLEEERRAKLDREERERLEAEDRARKAAEDRARRTKLKEEAEEAERQRLKQARVSDPVSDDSSDENKSLVAPPTGRAARAGGASRFRFTKDFSPDLDDPRATFDATNTGTRQVAMEPGDTVLHVAANCCHEQDVLKLLQNGADINARNRRGRTPLHTASHYGNVEVVGILLDWEADVLVQDDDGNTPLHLSRDHRIARMLLEAGCTPNIVNADGRTALIDSVDRGDTATVKLLLRFKADVLFRELKHHQTALHLAVRKGHYQIVMELCKSDEIENLVLLTDRNENNCLHFAVSRDRKNGFRLVDYLIKHGAEVNKVNARLQTPLVVHIMTTRQTDPAITELFLSHGADGNVSLADGSTLLHVSVERELIDIACSFIKYGSSLNQPDAKGRLVVDVANKKYLKKLFSAITMPPTWIDEKTRRACMLCSSGFKFAARKHHCRHCGRVCCSDCSSFTVELFRFPKDFPGRAALGNSATTSKAAKEPQRVCRTCHAVFKMRSAQKESKSGFMARVLGYEWDEVTEMH